VETYARGYHLESSAQHDHLKQGYLRCWDAEIKRKRLQKLPALLRNASKPSIVIRFLQ
jgi:hypothetical protein